jgi:signal transduction histidine kinase
MPNGGAAKLVPSTRRVTREPSSPKQKNASKADKGRAHGRTVRLKSKIVIAAAQPLSGVNRRPQPVETLFAVSRAVGSRRDITEVLRQATRELVRALGADFGSVWRVDPTDRALQPVAGYRAARGASGAAAPSAALLAGAATDVSDAIYSSDSAHDPRFNHPLLRLLPHRSVLIQPLRVGDEIAGIFGFVWTRSRHRFNDVELRLVEAVTQQAAIAIENAELLGEVRALNGDLERRVRDRTRELETATEQLRASRAELRALGTHLESVREEERAHISREIHDELGQALTALKMDLARVSSGDGTIDRAALPVAIDDMIAAVRRISSELRPQMLDDLGLLAALEWYAHEFEKRTGIRCRFQKRGRPGEDAIDPARATALYRIFQEIMTNVARHAEATRVGISLEIGETSIRLTVRDNGMGMQLALRDRRPSLGILGMKERATVMGGSVSVAGAPGRGTVVRARLPLRRRELEASAVTPSTGGGAQG